MRSWLALLFLEHAVAVCAASESTRPRGVAPEFAKYFKNTNTFTCISHPSITIPFSRVNDDYCDCPDGSDEPGTSACAHLSDMSPRSPADSIPSSVNSTLALPGFYCKNKGHIASYVPFTRVNDGVCDYQLCCDGSEEWQSVGGTRCENKCPTIGAEWRKKSDARQKSLDAAARKRKDMVTEARKLRRQVEDRIQTLGTEISAAELKLKNTEQELVDAERREKSRLIRRSNDSQSGKLGVLVELGKQRTQELRGRLVQVRTERDQARGRVEELEQILSTFKTEYNPNFNDEGVKRAVRSWEDYAARDQGPGIDAAADADLDAIVLEDKDNGLDWASFEQEEDSETDILYAFENYLPPSIRSWVHAKLSDLQTMLVKNGILADRSTSTESPVVTDARSRRDAAKQSLENSQNDLKNHQEDLEKDFGPDDVFRTLKGQCISKNSGEYDYELCFMDHTMQKPQKGGGNVNMGNFAGIDRMVTDEDESADGKGLGRGERIVMKYENGQHCWNGPSRSTMVILACSEQNEVWKIVEEEKCVYRMEVGTPAVCETRSSTPAPAAIGKDEL